LPINDWFDILDAMMQTNPVPSLQFCCPVDLCFQDHPRNVAEVVVKEECMILDVD